MRKKEKITAFSKSLTRAFAIVVVIGILLTVLNIALYFQTRGYARADTYLLLCVIVVVLLLVGALACRSAKKKARDMEEIASLLLADSAGKKNSGGLYAALQSSLETKQELYHMQRKLEKQLHKITLQSRVRDAYVAIEQIEKRLDVEVPYIMVYVHVDFAESFRREVQELGKSTFFLKELISLYLEKFEDDATVFQIESDQIVFIVDGNAEIDRIILMLQDKLDSESEYASFTFVVSEVHSQREPIKDVYDRLSSIAKYRIPGAKTKVLRETSERIRTERVAFDGDLKNDFLEALQNESIESCINYVNRLLDRCLERGGSGVEIQLLCSEISVCIDELLCNVFSSIPEELGSLNSCLKFAQAITPEQYKKTVRDYITRAVSYLRIHRRTEDHIIGFILDYVEKHYAEDIYLNLFSEKLQLTAAYISSYFKEKMNVNLSDYINHFRIKKAIHLMETTPLKNKDIAVQVGLPNINTFIRLFKKHAGTTPGEYRKHHLSNE